MERQDDELQKDGWMEGDVNTWVVTYVLQALFEL
jgi:hypothetical protein